MILSILSIRRQDVLFSFFCKERYDNQKLSELVDACYRNHMEFRGETIPSFGAFRQSFKSEIYPLEMVARMLLDYEYNPNEMFALSGFDDWLSLEQIKEGFHTSGKSTDEFLLWIESRFFLHFADPSLEKDDARNSFQDKMESDLRVVLLNHDFFFFDCDYHYEAIRSYEKMSNKTKDNPTRKSLLFYNAPVKRVW